MGEPLPHSCSRRSQSLPSRVADLQAQDQVVAGEEGLDAPRPHLDSPDEVVRLLASSSAAAGGLGTGTLLAAMNVLSNRRRRRRRHEGDVDEVQNAAAMREVLAQLTSGERRVTWPHASEALMYLGRARYRLRDKQAAADVASLVLVRFFLPALICE